MGWFNKKEDDKPKEGDIHYTKLPVDGNKLNSYMGDRTGNKEHPVIPVSNNLDGTTNVIGCSSKYHPELGDIEIKTTPKGMTTKTYARLSDGERVIEDEKLRKDREHRRVDNKTFKEIKDRL